MITDDDMVIHVDGMREFFQLPKTLRSWALKIGIGYQSVCNSERLSAEIGRELHRPLPEPGPTVGAYRLRLR